MQIAYLSTFYPFRGGIAQFNASLLQTFVDMGHRAQAYTFTCQYPGFLFPGKTQMVTTGDNAMVIDSTRVLNTINPFSYCSTAKRINREAPDLLLMKYWMPFFGPSLGTVAGRLKNQTKSIAILDNFIPHEKKFFDTAFNSYFVKRVNGFVAMSDKVKTDLLNHKPDAHVMLMPHPVYNHFGQRTDKESAQQKLGLDPKKKSLLFFGFIRTYKGLDNLIRAFNLLDESYQLIIAGETYGSFEKYANLIEENKFKSNIKVYNDYIPDNAVANFFSASDVCILPYRSATQSGITSISYNFDVPVIATNTGGLAEFIENGSTGLIIADSNPETIADGIRRFYADCNISAMQQRISEIKQNLSWEHFAGEIIKFSKTL